MVNNQLNKQPKVIATWKISLYILKRLKIPLTVRLVIPCHYNIPALFTKEYCKADEDMFKIQVEKLGSDCQILKNGDEIEV